jgi:phosphatidylglycerol:prolipoprotein diacylglycerol transferase
MEARDMFTVNVDPVLLRLGPLAISWYGLAVMAAMGVGLWLTLREARRKGLPTEPIMDLVFWIAIGGLIGARMLYVIDRWEAFASSPLQIFALHQGGISIMGAIIGGAMLGGVGAWRMGLPIRRLFDTFAPGLILGQAIGRFGCLITGDTVGRPTDGSWGIVYLNPGARVPQLGVAYQPAFFYEQLWDLAVFAILWQLRGLLKEDGQLFALYLGLYALGKFAITFVRIDPVWLWGMQEAHFVALGLLAVAIIWALWGRLGLPMTRTARLTP